MQPLWEPLHSLLHTILLLTIDYRISKECCKSIYTEHQYALLGLKETHPYHLLLYQALGGSIFSHSDGITHLWLLNLMHIVKCNNIIIYMQLMKLNKHKMCHCNAE